MNIGFYTSKHYLEAKKEALRESIKKLGIEAVIVDDIENPPSISQTFGFEPLFQMAKSHAAEALRNQTVDVGIGVMSGLSFIYAAHEWYYVICIAMKTRGGATAENFTSGISVPEWMVKEVQDKNIKLDALTERLAGEGDPVIYFSEKTLERKDLMVPALLLAFSKLGLGKSSQANSQSIHTAPR